VLPALTKAGPRSNGAAAKNGRPKPKVKRV